MANAIGKAQKMRIKEIGGSLAEYRAQCIAINHNGYDIDHSFQYILYYLMKAYRIIAYQNNLRVDHVVEAENDKAALNKFSELVDQGKCEITEDGFTGNSRIHITYEELNESEKNRAVEKTSTP